MAQQLVSEAFRWAAANGLKVDPQCTFVSGAFLARRPELLVHVIPGSGGASAGFDTHFNELD
jgi:hypothetical protein